MTVLTHHASLTLGQRITSYCVVKDFVWNISLCIYIHISSNAEASVWESLKIMKKGFIYTTCIVVYVQIHNLAIPSRKIFNSFCSIDALLLTSPFRNRRIITQSSFSYSHDFTHFLLLICLFLNVNEMAETKSLANRPNPELRKELM